MDKGRLLAGGFTRDDFERYVNLRFGTGDPVYWYGWGGATTFPGEKMVARIEGCDMGRLYRPDSDKPEAQLLARKFTLSRDPETGEILTLPDGSPMWMKEFPYQYFKIWLENGIIHFETEQGAGDNLTKMTSGHNSEIQRFEGMTIYTTPVQYQLPWRGDAHTWETYNWIERTVDGKVQYDCVWHGDFPTPPGTPPGRMSMNAYFHRYDSYDELPETLRSFIEEHAPLWKGPPESLEEIRELQK